MRYFTAVKMQTYLWALDGESVCYSSPVSDTPKWVQAAHVTVQIILELVADGSMRELSEAEALGIGRTDCIVTDKMPETRQKYTLEYFDFDKNRIVRTESDDGLEFREVFEREEPTAPVKEVCPISNTALWSITPPKQREQIVAMIKRQNENSWKLTERGLDIDALSRAERNLRAGSAEDQDEKTYWRLTGGGYE